MHGSLSFLLKKLHVARDGTDLQPLFHEIREVYSLAHITYLSAPSGVEDRVAPIFHTTYPEEWTSLYVDRKFFDIDPVIAACRSSLLPVDWSRLDQSPPAIRHFFGLAKSFGVGHHGITLPVRGGKGERSLFSVTSDLPRRQWLRFRQSHLGELHILSQHVHEAVFSLSASRTDDDRRPLSKRERDCLQLLARGLLSKQIAARLQISESAVRQYLRAARLKLRASTVYQAVALASYLELIQF